MAVGCSIIVCVFTYLYVRSRAQVKTMKDINQIIKLSMEFRKIDPEDKKVVAKVMGATSSLVRRNSLAPNDSSGKQRKRDKLADKLGMSKLKSKFKTEVSELVKTHIYTHHADPPYKSQFTPERLHGHGYHGTGQHSEQRGDHREEGLGGRGVRRGPQGQVQGSASGHQDDYSDY